jgi:hypothetical protein
VHPDGQRDRILCMDKHSQLAMPSSYLARQADVCRAQAKHFSKPECDLLRKMANSFDEIAADADLRKAVAAGRCW